MKWLAAILSCLLLLAGQVIAVQPSPGCTAQSVHACTDCCCKMACCATKAHPQAPVAPTRSVSQNQLLVLALASLVLAQQPVDSGRQVLPSVDRLHFVTAVPIFQRDCAILI